MKWSKRAEEAVSRVPFFVRKRVKKKVEEEALHDGAGQVELEHVHACQKRFLGNMESEVRGHRVENCFGPNGCPNRAVESEGLAQRLDELVAGKQLKAFLKDRVKSPLKMHHEFRISISDCPNACSRPQIVDVGLIGARRPMVSEEACTGCGACVEACREGAVVLRRSEDGTEGPAIDREKCLSCGKCLEVCPAGALRELQRGYRVLVGGKLGRHPQLALELKGIRSAEESVATVERCLALYMKHNRGGERFGDIVNKTGVEHLNR